MGYKRLGHRRRVDVFHRHRTRELGESVRDNQQEAVTAFSLDEFPKYIYRVTNSNGAGEGNNCIGFLFFSILTRLRAQVGQLLET